MKSSILMTMLMMGMMNDGYGKRITYHNGTDSKLSEVDIKAEYELIKQKKSQLSANTRKLIVRYVERES